MSRYRNHVVIPDTQVKHGVPISHLRWAGKYIRDYEPEVLVLLGDWWDWPCFSRYDDNVKKVRAGYSIMRDFRAGVNALETFMRPWEKSYKPKRKVFLNGNHENRRARHLQAHPTDDSVPSTDDYLRSRGWEVHPFLRPVQVDGISYAHYFCKNSQGKVMNINTGQPSAATQLSREMCSSIAGHKQGFDSAMHEANNRRVRSIIAGSFYQHREGYLGEQGNDHWQGILHLHDVRKGDFDLEEVSLGRLRRMYR